MTQFFTIGHSDRSLVDFLALLAEAEIDAVIDVRRLPGSNKFPWFNQAELAEALAEHGIAYHHEPGLTGRRPRQQDVPDDRNGFWTNRSFHNYADYALSEEFTEALARLRATAFNRPVLMCSEAVWWRCHRRIITDHLLAHGDKVTHILGPGNTSQASMTEGAVVENGTVTYPPTSA